MILKIMLIIRLNFEQVKIHSFTVHVKDDSVISKSTPKRHLSISTEIKF